MWCFVGMNTPIKEGFPSDIRDSLSVLRIGSPKARTAMVRSLSIHGQISPLVCLRHGNDIELIDGFKRLHACRILQWPLVQVRFVDTTMCVAKMDMIRLNRISRSITPIEEALIVHSMHRNDRLSQQEIAVLISHDRRWVARRCDLAERLHEDIRHNLLAGTISGAIAWELAQLPRDTQSNCLARILKYRLNPRDIGTILRHSSNMPWNGTDPLEWPWRILEESDSLPARSRQAWYRRLAALNHHQRLLLGGAVEDLFPDNERDGRLVLETIENGRKMHCFLESHLRDDPEF